MMKGIRRNQKGTVLLTVLCFTTMCMVIAAIALRISNRANAQSTENVMKSQAQITAEHYLEKYLSTFPTVTGSDGEVRYNYDSLRTIAGANEENPATITISVKQASNLSEVNVSNANLATTAAYGGNCTIYVYKTGSGGIVVKSMGDYDGQTGLASAYFYGEAPSASLNKNAIETCGAYGVGDTAEVSGDILLSYVDPNVTIRFKNNNGDYHSNYKLNGNLYNNDEPVRFRDTLQGNAPTITVEGYIYFYQMDIQTTVGKTDANGKHATDSGYDLNHLLNKNGYINCDKKIFLSCIKSGNIFGGDKKPIDFYCRGMVLGKIPQTAYGSYNAAAVAKFKQDIETIFQSTDENAAGPTIYGNIYCYKRAGGTISDDGDFIANTMNSQTIHGDLVVDGNIYIMGAPLTVTGNVYCTGTVTGDIKDSAGKYFNKADGSTPDRAISKTLPSDARSIQPLMNYSPGLYVYGTNENPTIYSPQNYKEQNPYKMYQQNDVKSKFFKDKYLAALENTLATSGVATGYVDDSKDNIVGKEIHIKKSCRLNPVQIGVGIGGANDGAKFIVDVVDQDIWILLPATPGATPAANSANLMRARFMVNNPGDGHHCYFVFYNYDSSAYSLAGFDNEDDYYKSADGKDDAAIYYERQAGDFPAETIFQIAPNTGGKCSIFTSDFAGWDSQNPTNADAETNIVFLVPDDFTLELGDGGFITKMQAVVYGPLATFNPRINTGNKVYGQVKVNYYNTDGASQDPESMRFNDLSKDSILHSFLTQGAAGGGILNLQYYIRHK
ncbi:hypothetical protein SAMN02910317_03148 [Ruminococcaceae bacterium FB2012]|nr:hypothetical protein SAMN02910317_03148 [Ruminococcaceae bacterium FB2012]